MRFMVTNHMTQAPTDEIFALFPAEQARTAELMQQGVLERLEVAADFSQAWLVIRSATQHDAQQAVESLPLARFMRREITPLAELA